MGSTICKHAVCACPRRERGARTRRWPAGKCDVCGKPKLKACCEDGPPCGLPLGIAKFFGDFRSEEYVEEKNAPSSRPSILLKAGVNGDPARPSEYSADIITHETVIFNYEDIADEASSGNEVSAPAIVETRSIHVSDKHKALIDDAIQALYKRAENEMINMNEGNMDDDIDYSSDDDDWHVPKFLTPGEPSCAICPACGNIYGSSNCFCLAQGDTPTVQTPRGTTGKPRVRPCSMVLRTGTV